MKNSICFDWFEFTSFFDSPKTLIDMLGLSFFDFVETYGSSGYRSGLMFENIFIFFDGRSDMGVHCRMSGQGCRAFEKYSKSNWKDLIKDVCSDYYKISRIDIAYDDYKGLLDMDCIVDDVNNRRFVTRFRSDPEVIYRVDKDCNRSYTVNFGRKSSNTFFRIYDKLAERKHKEIHIDNLNHWVRAEIMLRNDNARSFLLLLSEGKPIEELYFLVLNNYLRFVVVSDTDSNRWRWSLSPHWAAFCNSVISEKISLFVSPDDNYNVFKLDYFVTRQAGAAIYTYIQMFGIKDLMSKVDEKKYKLAVKYRSLLSYDEEVVK